MITDDNELKQSVAIVNEHIQKIQDYLGQKSNPDGKIRFPRNFIRTASYFRERLSFVRDKNIKDNLAYALIQSDILRWLIERTDIYSTAKEMVVKAWITLMGSICETMAIDYTEELIGKKHGFCERCNRMAARGIISDKLKIEMHWLWNTRTAIHIFEIDFREYEKYNIEDYNRSMLATRKLRDALSEHALKKTK